MFIEFELPNGAGGMATGYALSQLQTEINNWAGQYGVKYKTKLHKYTFRLCFENNEQYTFFQLSWNPVNSIGLRYKIIENR